MVGSAGCAGCELGVVLIRGVCLGQARAEQEVAREQALQRARLEAEVSHACHTIPM